MNSATAAPADLGRFISEPNIRIQKAYLFSISFFILVAIATELLDRTASVVSYLFDVNIDNIDEKNKIQKNNLIIILQYLLIYFMFHYTFNYIFASITYFSKYNKAKIILSGGLFVVGKVMIDWLAPVGLTLYVLYRLNLSCDSCMLGPNDQIASDLSAFFEWIARYFDHKLELVINLGARMEGIYFEHVHQFVRPAFRLLSTTLASLAELLREWAFASPVSDSPKPWYERPELRSYFCYDVDTLCWTNDYGSTPSRDAPGRKFLR